MSEKTYSISSRKDRKGQKRRVEMKGDLSFRNAKVIRDQLSRISLTEPFLEMSLEEVERLDLTVIQIIRAMQRRARDKGVEMEMHLALSEDMQGMLDRVGFSSYFNK